MAALAARGMIQRLNGIPGSRTVRWTYLPKDDIVAPSDVDAVEALLSNPAAPSRRNTRQTKGPVNSQMSISSAPIVTAKPARPSVLSSIRRHIAAIVLVMIFAAGLGLAVSLSVRPLEGGHVDRGPSAPTGVDAMSPHADHTTPDPASLSSPHPTQPAALPDTSPDLVLMMAMRRRRRMHHSAWRSRS